MSEKNCFVIMPISTPEDYDENHFYRVYNDILKPACKKAGYKPIRADDVKQTNLIHSDILEKLLESEMVLCDLSSTNPNVLFELGLRQAFDKPVTLVQEKGTDKIFDISVLRMYEYQRERKYDEVLEDQTNIAENLNATQKAFDENDGINSIIRLLSFSKAELKDTSEFKKDPNIELLRTEIGDLKNDIKNISKNNILKGGGEIGLLAELTNLKVELNDLKNLLEDSPDNLLDKDFIQSLLYNIQDKLFSLESRAQNSIHADVLFNIRHEVDNLKAQITNKE